MALMLAIKLFCQGVYQQYMNRKVKTRRLDSMSRLGHTRRKQWRSETVNKRLNLRRRRRRKSSSSTCLQCLLCL